MKLIVGLGNPGREYEHTRHNVGFEVLDRLARRHAPGAVAKSKYHAAVLDADVDGERVLLVKPTTFMNRSGLSVSEAVQFYKLEIESDLLIIVDDVALPCGHLRFRPSGGAGGHNGLADVEQKLGTPEYGRLRIGVDSSGQIPQKDYVLGRFRPEQKLLVDPSLDDAADAARCWVKNGMAEAMNRFNQRNTPQT
ncbi:MAG: aminoacyl-tRNA hydrolase [Planctomycetota bacterium]|nr:aminoacyl-tRNA hydrolase [Planctomycetota bacterium]